MYNTTINIIAGIPDFNLIFDIIQKYANGIQEEKNERDNNHYGIRTNRAKKRFIQAINNVFINFRTENHKLIFYQLFSKPNLYHLKKIALFFQCAINNQLFYDLTTHVFLKLYNEGRIRIGRSDFISYLYEQKEKNNEIKNWSDSTIELIASKYLTFLKKNDFLKGRAIKEFTHIYFDDATIIYIVYFISSLENHSSDFLNNPYAPLLMMSNNKMIERLKKISLKNFFTITTLGYNLKIELKYKYEEIVDVITQNYGSEI